MASPSEVEFPAFPFQPYSIQLELMKAVYGALQKGGVAIVESPTGTGKTLSLICSVLQWLQDQKHVTADGCCQDSSAEQVDDEPLWMRNFSNKSPTTVSAKVNSKVLRGRRSKKMGDDGESLFFYHDVKAADKRGPLRVSESPPRLDNDEAFLLDDYNSDGESETIGLKKRKDPSGNKSTDESSMEEEDAPEQPLKVFFCSRTHSQLSQFVKELEHTTFSRSLKTVSMGSRKSLCINSEVAKLKHSFLINERCLELQRKKNDKRANKKVPTGKVKKTKRSAGGCPMLRKYSLQREFRERAWESDILDIEDLVKLGESIGTCPYYASRAMVPWADLVVLPYQSMLHEATRESVGLKLKDCVVIIDEAHNLVDSITDMYSCQISETQLQQVQLSVTAYLSKFRELLGAGNRRYIQTLLSLIQGLLNRLASSLDIAPSHKRGIDVLNGSEKEEILSINDFLFQLDIDNINMFKLWHYIKESNIVHKVSGYAEKVSVLPFNKDNGKGFPEVGGTVTSFHALAEMILALMNADADGRVLVVPRSTSCADSGEQHHQEAYIKFVMLNAARAFMKVVNEAHAVILAGGTLQPIEELQYRLFPQLSGDRVHHFSCGHIVPAENVLAIAVARGPTGRTFDFTYNSRGLPETMEELGQLIFNVCLVVPEGLVVFLPSFDYEQQLYSAWEAMGILGKLQKKKVLFREPRDAASVELTLQSYKDTIMRAATRTDNKTGAVILCVVGGKMSEGINFSDGMGRCVVMVGLPYPSPSDPELLERMRYIDEMSKTSCLGKFPPARCSPYLGRDYYENLCMKAVNQSIGRAIRHIGDYASILLVDVRYTAPSSRQASKLPNWIKERLVHVTGNFGKVQRLLHQFFKAKGGAKNV